MRLQLPSFAALTLALLACTALPTLAGEAQDSARQPAFSLSSSRISSTREQPSIMLTFRQLDHLDFRVYKVRDPMTFFAGLRDPHVLGSEQVEVPHEETWIERISGWKARARSAARSFARRQLSPAYRQERRARTESRQVVVRQTVAYRDYAQVPLLNPSQVVATWRELLPRLGATDARRIPLGVAEPGVYLVEAVHENLRAFTIAIVSDVGIVTKSSPGQMVVFAADRFTGEPVADCEVRTLAGQSVVGSGTTGDDGTLELRFGQVMADSVIAVARCGQHVTASDPGAWYLSMPAGELAGYIYTDKPVYRPGHTVHLKGVLRWRERGTLRVLDASDVEVRITDPNNKVIFRERRPVDEYGSVHVAFPIPAGAALGHYCVTIQRGDHNEMHAFEVQEYRKPEFEVIVSPGSRFVLQGEKAKIVVRARYYFGQPVAGGAATCTLHRQPYYSPLRWSDEEGEGGTAWWGAGEELPGQTILLDATGTGELTVPTPQDADGRDYSLRIEARVTDASGREVSGASIVHATYGRFLLTASLDRHVHAPGSTATVRTRALDYSGNPQPGIRLRVLLERLHYRQRQRWQAPEATLVAEATAETDADGYATAAITFPREAGDYRIRVTARSGDREVQESAYAWVPGSEAPEVESDTFLELVPDRRSYAPGEVARLTLKGTSFAPMLVSKEAEEVSTWQVVRPGESGVFEVPITDDDAGDIWVNVAFLKDNRLYRAERRLSVPATSRQLNIRVTPGEPVSRPGQVGRFRISVTDSRGQPVRAQVSLGVIDEAVYGVKPDTTPDPLRFFHRRTYSRVSTAFSRDYSFVGYSGTEQLLLTRRRRPLTYADFKADRPGQPQVRKDFPDAIYWKGDIETDARGEALVEVRYPDSLTTWRITARAVTADTLVGAAVERTTTTKDLIVRVILPRFLTEGDEAVVPVVVHNYLPGGKEVQVGLDTTGGATIEHTASGAAPGGRATVIEEGGEARLDWLVRAESPGPSTFTGRAIAGSVADVLELPLPILPFGLKQTNAASGSIVGPGESETELIVPEGANPAGRTISVSLAPSLAGALLGALDFLTSYPYGCTEQILSSLVPNVMVLKALEQLDIEPAERMKTLDRQVSENLRRLYDYQHEDGGWGWWKTDENHPFMTAYAAYGLLETRSAGYQVEEWRLRNARRALEQMYLQHPRALPDLKAYMAYVLALTRRAERDHVIEAEPGGYDERKSLDDLWAARSRMSHYGKALLLLALDTAGDPRGAELAREVSSAATRKGDLAWWHVPDDPLLGDHAETSVEATALAVKALAARNPRDPLLEPAVRWLMLNRTRGSYWGSTKQTAMALYGLLEYMRARGEAVHDSLVEVFVNGESAGTRSFVKADLTSPDPAVLVVPARAGVNRVRLVNRGSGTVYWSASAEYYDRSLPIERTGTRTLALVRTYTALSPAIAPDGRVVYREAPVPERVAPGDLLLVRVTAAGSSDWRYLVVEDPLPAGAEPVQKTELYELEGDTRARWLRWYSGRREYRDDRVVFFQPDLGDGRFEFSYMLRVTTPGSFHVLPARISPMYVPGVQASTDAGRLNVASPGERGAGKQEARQ